MTSLLVIIELIVYTHLSHAAPTRNLTALKTQYAPSFVAEPDGRGIWGLLYSCTFTLALCLWTAFHPNVKRPGASEIANYGLKWRWLTYNAFAPELGVLTAFKQFQQSRALAAELSRLGSEAATNGSSNNARGDKDSGPSQFQKVSLLNLRSNQAFTC